MMTTNRTSFPQSKQPCWDCANACGKCAWSARFQPIPGWVATATVIKCNSGYTTGVVYTASYAIHFCPQFKAEPERKNDG